MPSKEMFEMREEIKNIIENLGIWSMPKKHLAEKYHIARTTLDRHIRKIIKGWPKDSIEETNFTLQKSYKRALQEAQKILIDPASTKQEKINAGRLIDLLGKGITMHLESYGDKPIVSKDLNVKIEGSAEISLAQFKDLMKKYEVKE